MEVDRIRDEAWEALRKLKLQCVLGERVLDPWWYQQQFSEIEAYMKMIEKSDHVKEEDE